MGWGGKRAGSGPKRKNPQQSTSAPRARQPIVAKKAQHERGFAPGGRVAGDGGAVIAPLFRPAAAATPALEPDASPPAREPTAEDDPAAEPEQAAEDDDAEEDERRWREWYKFAVEEIKKRGKNPYIHDNLWFRPPSLNFLLDRARFPDPSEVTQPPILMVFPNRLMPAHEKLKCFERDSGCLGSMVSDGFDHGESKSLCRFVRGFDSYAVLSNRFECDACHRKCKGTNDRLLDQLPPHRQSALRPYVSGHHSGLDQRTADFLLQGFAHGQGPEACAAHLRVQAALDYDRIRLAYHQALEYRAALGDPTIDFAKLPEFPPFDGVGAPRAPVPSAKWLRSTVLSQVAAMRKALDQAISILEGRILAGDASFKIIGHTISGFLSSCHTFLNEYGEIRLQVLALSKALAMLRPSLVEFQKSLRSHGFPQVEMLFIDNILNEASFFRSAIPSLNNSVMPVPLPNESGLPRAELPTRHDPNDPYIFEYVSTAADIEQICGGLLGAAAAKLRKGEEFELGFDLEWTSADQTGEEGGVGDVATIQLSLEREGWLLQIAGLEHLPPNLVSVLTSPHIRKIGRNVAGDATKLEKDYKVKLVGGLELLVVCRDRGIIGEREKKNGLATLVSLALGQHLSKPPSVRQSNWDGPLQPDQQRYAMLDARIALQVLIAARRRTAYNLRITSTTPAGTLITYRAVQGKTSQLIGQLVAFTDEQLAAGKASTPSLLPTPPATPLPDLTFSTITHRRVLVQRVDTPAYRPPGYRASLLFTAAPFSLLLPMTHLYTRPPLADLNALPPPDIPAAYEAQAPAAQSGPNGELIEEDAQLQAELDDELEGLFGGQVEEEDEEEEAGGDGTGDEVDAELGMDEGSHSGLAQLLNPIAAEGMQLGNHFFDDNPPPPSANIIPETNQEHDSRIYSDVVHGMFKLTPMAAHPLAGVFKAKLRDTFFSVDQEDRANVIRALKAEHPDWLDNHWERALRLKPDWVWVRVKRRVPPPEVLVPLLSALFNSFRDLPDPKTKKPLFTSTTRKQEAPILELARAGYFSDPKGTSLYVKKGFDEKHQLTLYRCLRGTNAVEGMHAKLIKWMSAFNADPELANAFLALFRHHHNCDVGSQNRYGVKYRGHYNPVLMAELDSLYWKIRGKSAYLHYTNPSHYEQTKEKFGLVPLPSSMLRKLGLESEPADGSILDDGLPYRYLATCLGTKYPVAPIRTPREKADFYDELRKLQQCTDGSTTALFSKRPDFDALTYALNQRVGQSAAEAEAGEEDAQASKLTPFRARRAYHLINQVATFWKAAKAASTGQALLVENSAELAEILAALEPEARELNAPQARTREELELEASGANRPAQVRPSALSNARAARLGLATLKQKKKRKSDKEVRRCAVCLAVSVPELASWSEVKLDKELSLCKGNGGRKWCRNLDLARSFRVKLDGELV